jgi:general stress protein 26
MQGITMNTAATQETPDTLWPRIERVRIGMFTTVDDDGHLVSCPMSNQQVDHHGSLWFFTSDQSSMSRNIAARPQVNVSFVHGDESLYVSVSGHAEHITDQARMREMWNPLVAAWFPQGLDDPHLALVKVTIDSAEYWDSDQGKMTQLLRMARAAMTGHPPEIKPGEHGRVNL